MQSAEAGRPQSADDATERRPRKAPPTGFALSTSALVGLYFIQRYRFLTIAQFGRAASLKPSFAAELLRSLEARSFLGYFGNVGMRGHGKTPKVYYLTRKGYELLRRESDIPDELLGTFKETFIEAKWSPQTYHRLSLVDLLIALEVAVREREQLSLTRTWLEYRRIKLRGRTIRETTDFVAADETAENRIIPDAAFVIENLESHRRGLFFLEMDMGTERIVSRISRDPRITLHFKMEQYDRYLQSGRFAATYRPWGEFSFATVLFVTDSEARMNNIRREMLDLPPALHAYYRFNTYERAAANFLNDEWKARSPDDDRGYMLVR
jgi:DNA-binding PadR family transcriptional regulator